MWKISRSEEFHSRWLNWTNSIFYLETFHTSRSGIFLFHPLIVLSYRCLRLYYHFCNFSYWWNWKFWTLLTPKFVGGSVTFLLCERCLKLSDHFCDSSFWWNRKIWILLTQRDTRWSRKVQSTLNWIWSFPSFLSFRCSISTTVYISKEITILCMSLLAHENIFINATHGLHRATNYIVFYTTFFFSFQTVISCDKIHNLQNMHDIFM